MRSKLRSDCPLPLTTPVSPLPVRREPTACSGSMARRILEEPGLTAVTRPTRPAWATTAMPTATPELAPLSRKTVHSALEGPWLITLAPSLRPAVQGCSWRRPSASLSWRCISGTWFCWSFRADTWARSLAFWLCRCGMSPMDRKMWPTGDRALLTPACNGARMVSTSSCTLRSGPLLPWRKSRVTTVTLAASRAARTTRDLVALRYDVLLKATSRTTLGEAAGSVAARSDEHRLQRLEFLQTFAGTDGHARQRVLGQMHGHPGLMLEALVEPLQEGASAGQHDSLVHDVCSQLRWRPVERRLHGVDDRVHRLLDGPADLLRGHDDGLRQPGDEVAPTDLGIRLVGQGEGRAD